MGNKSHGALQNPYDVDYFFYKSRFEKIGRFFVDFANFS